MQLHDPWRLVIDPNAHSRLSLPGAMMQVCLFVVSFSVDVVCLSSTEQKQCGSVDSIELVVVK